MIITTTSRPFEIDVNCSRVITQSAIDRLIRSQRLELRCLSALYGINGEVLRIYCWLVTEPHQKQHQANCTTPTRIRIGTFSNIQPILNIAIKDAPHNGTSSRQLLSHCLLLYQSLRVSPIEFEHIPKMTRADLQE